LAIINVIVSTGSEMVYEKIFFNSSSGVSRRADGLDNVTLDQIYQEMDSVAINLKTLRNRLQCSCSLPFQHYSKRVSRFFAQLQSLPVTAI